VRELIAQRTLLSRGDSKDGSVCDDKRHGNGIRNDCRKGGDDSGGQSRRISSDGDSNGGSSVFKDSNGFKDNRGFAGICNSEGVSDYNGGVWDYVNAVKGVANGGSNSGGVGDIDSGSGVVADSNGVEAGGSDETRDAAGEAVVEGTVFGSSNERMMAMHVTMRIMAMHVTMVMNLTMRMVALMAMDVLVPVGTVLMAVVVLMTLLKVRKKPHSRRCEFDNAAEGMGDQRIEDANLANDNLCEAVEEGELRHCGGIESSEE